MPLTDNAANGWKVGQRETEVKNKVEGDEGHGTKDHGTTDDGTTAFLSSLPQTRFGQ